MNRVMGGSYEEKNIYDYRRLNVTEYAWGVYGQ